MSTADAIKRVANYGLYAATHPKKIKHGLKKLLARKRLHKEREEDYVIWFDAHRHSPKYSEEQRKAAKKFKHRPLVSIILPLYNTPEHFLRQCLDSVLAQTYDNWELCVADDASPEPHVRQVVDEYATKHPNIKFTRLSANQHIVGASNEALKLARGEFIGLLDHDDLLLPNALFEVVDELNRHPDADLIYSDEDKVDENDIHVEPFFKPDWSPDFLLSCNYITHFAFLRKTIVDKIGGFRFGTEGAQDWDLFLRFTAESQKVYHVSKILYSWRKSDTSTAKAAKSKPYAYINQKRVLRDALAHNRRAVSVYDSVWLGFWRVSYAISDNPLVSIVIPTKDNPKLIRQCINSIIELTNYANFEIVIVDTGSINPAVHDFYGSKVVRSNRITVVDWKADSFNFSSACNFGARHSKGDYLVFLNDDTEVITSDWIKAMLEHAQRDDIGMVGCKLLFPDKNIQHAGVVLREHDIAVHPFYNSHEKQDIFSNIYISNIRDCLAVTAACSMVAKKKFDQVGGFDETLRVTYNDVDLCLRLYEAGYINLYTPYAELYHYESVSVGKVSTADRDVTELEASQKLMRERWGTYLKRDPFYNDNFATTGLPYHVVNK